MSQMTSEAQLETMLTIRQVADFLHVSISTVRRWSDSRMLKSYRVGPRGDRRYLRDDVLSFLEESTRHPKTGASGEKIVN
jgi:excisionase family DNA binding protein